jgi:hypothetical protein
MQAPVVALCHGALQEGIWWPRDPDHKYWRQRADGGQGLSKRVRCPICRRRMPAILHTRVETVAGEEIYTASGATIVAEADGRLVAFLFEMPEH